MPTYEYRCRDCGEPLEVVQSFTDEPLDTCPSCGGSLRKVFGAVGISFKGSGFYKTDSRGGSKRSSSSSESSTSESSSGTKTDSSKADSTSSTKSDASSNGNGSGSSSPSTTPTKTPA